MKFLVLGVGGYFPLLHPPDERGGRVGINADATEGIPQVGGVYRDYITLASAVGCLAAGVAGVAQPRKQRCRSLATLLRGGTCASGV